jgi:hypothetical protein
MPTRIDCAWGVSRLLAGAAWVLLMFAPSGAESEAGRLACHPLNQPGSPGRNPAGPLNVKRRKG